jgi:diguanylate cyclase (GGDEF)-like protein
VIAASAYFGFAVPALIAQNKQLSELALKDGLTKAITRSHFFELAERELADARRYGQPLSLLVLDIDHFKQINDSFGHSAGDSALVNLVRSIRMHLRQSDLLGRFGGDEFMVLMPGVDLDHALAGAERLRQLLGQIHVPGTQHRLSASFGVVCVHDGETIMQAFRRADEAMLATKRMGRVGVTAA